MDQLKNRIGIIFGRSTKKISEKNLKSKINYCYRIGGTNLCITLNRQRLACTRQKFFVFCRYFWSHARQLTCGFYVFLLHLLYQILCICLVSIWWWQYWTKIKMTITWWFDDALTRHNDVRACRHWTLKRWLMTAMVAAKTKKPNWRLWEE